MKRLWLVAAFSLTFTAAFGQGTTPTGTNTAPGCTIVAGVITCGTQSLTPGTGSVTSVSVTTANGVSGSVATATTTPAITLSLGAITPTTAAIGSGTAITSSGPGGALASGAYAAAYSLPTATNSVLGGVKPDGTTITNNSGAIAAAATTINGTSCTPGGSCSPTPPVSSVSVFTTYDLTTASGTQVVSGFGFTPSACDGFGAVAGSAVGTYQTFNAHSDSALNQQAAYGNSGGTIATASVFFTATNLAGTANQIATITSYNAGSVTLTWVKTGSPTGSFVFTIRCFK